MCSVPHAWSVLRPLCNSRKLLIGVLTPPEEYGSAETQFKKIRELDPFRIDDIDILSNVLYVSENRLELSKLAHEVLALERDRPEICCLVGMYFYVSCTLPFFKKPDAKISVIQSLNFSI